MTSFNFGPFTLVPERRTLLEQGVPVRIGDRALEILVALVERRGEIVPKDELFARVWPKTHVEQSSLKVNVATLRRVLRESAASRTYISAVAGVGYRFEYPVTAVETTKLPTSPADWSPTHDNLPRSATTIFGRGLCIEELQCCSEESRLVTIVGAAGIGKTTVALAVARAVSGAYSNGAWFIDLAPLTDATQISNAVAAAVGLTIHAEQADASLCAFLRNRSILLVLDNCEHLTASLADIVQRILSETTNVHIIATSREPLRGPDERIYRLPPLEVPAECAGMPAAKAMSFSAIQLFVERAKSSGEEFALDDHDVSLVVGICRELDGIALAIELAATRVATLGISTVSTLLVDRFRWLNKGSRTAPQRQQTLSAALEWSYHLLTVTERLVLQRLSCFASSFSLDAACAIAAFGSVEREDAQLALWGLVDKSLISRDPIHNEYRLLETMRAFARQKLEEGGDHTKCQRAHSRYFLGVTQSAEYELDSLPVSEWRHVSLRTIDDVRAALRWSFADPDTLVIAISLVVAAIPLWARLSQFEECRLWAARVLSDPRARRQLAGPERMKLSVTLASVLLYTQGPTPQVNALFCQALPLAKRFGDVQCLLRSLYGLAYYRLYAGRYRAGMDCVASLRREAQAAKDDAFKIDAERLEASMMHYVGEHCRARRRVVRFVDDRGVQEQGRRLARFHLDHKVSARIILAHVLMVQGLLDQARDVARVAVEDTRNLGHVIAMGNTLVLAAIPVAFYRGDLDDAERLLALVADDVAQHKFVVCLVSCLRSTVLAAKGDRSEVVRLENAILELRAAGIGVRYPSYLGLLAQALGEIGRVTEGQRQISRAIQLAEGYEEAWCLPELLRIKAKLLLTDQRISVKRTAEGHLMKAIGLAQRQSALTWELRASIDLAQLLCERDDRAQARKLLSSICRKFTEGFETADLRQATRMLRDISESRKASV